MAYALLRATTGLNISLHGFTRIFIGGMPAFFNYMLGQFKDTVLPVWQVRAFAAVLPYAELVLGALLFVGLWTRWMSALGALVMMARVFGTSFRSDWNLVFLQMFYSFLYFLLLSLPEIRCVVGGRAVAKGSMKTARRGNRRHDRLDRPRLDLRIALF